MGTLRNGSDCFPFVLYFMQGNRGPPYLSQYSLNRMSQKRLIFRTDPEIVEGLDCEADEKMAKDTGWSLFKGLGRKNISTKFGELGSLRSKPV